MLYVTNKESLETCLKAIAQSTQLALDTEADSFHHYQEKLCLMQISTPSEDFVVDVIALEDWRRVLEPLNSKSLILHGADFDIRILKRASDGLFDPPKVFDTMIAASLCGYAQVGLSFLAKEICSAHLDKDNQTADWSLRPLTERMLEYAAMDTHYLFRIQEHLQATLTHLDRMDWLQQSCHKLLKNLSQSYAPKPKDEMRWQIKGSKELTPQALTILKHIWQWREQKAVALDRPPFKVLNNATLIDIASYAAESVDSVELMPKAPRNLKSALAREIDAIVGEAKRQGPTRWMRPRSEKESIRLDTHQGVILKNYKIQRDILAKTLKIQPGLIANNTQLEKITFLGLKDARQMVENDLLMPWQASLMATITSSV